MLVASNQLLVQTVERLVRLNQPLALWVGRAFQESKPTDLMNHSTDLTNQPTGLTNQPTDLTSKTTCVTAKRIRDFNMGGSQGARFETSERVLRVGIPTGADEDEACPGSLY